MVIGPLAFGEKQYS